MIWFQMLLGNVGHVNRIIDKNVIPGLVFWRAADRDLVIPVVCSLKVGINIGDDATIGVFFMVNNLADIKFCFSCHFLSFHRQVT